jgi:hypothetical protein
VGDGLEGQHTAVGGNMTEVSGLALTQFFFFAGRPNLFALCNNKFKLAIASPTSGGRSIGIVRLRTQTMEYFFNNTFSKWWEELRMSCRRVLSSTPLLVRGSETV